MTVTVDVTVTRARLIRSSPSHTGDTDEFVTMGPSTTIDFYYYFAGALTETHLYIVEIDGQTFPSEDYFPAVPDGMALTDVRPWVTAYVLGTQGAYDGSADGYLPPPTKSPFLDCASTDFLSFDTWAATSFPGSQTICGAPDDLSLFVPGGSGAGADNFHANHPNSLTVHIVLTAFGYRFTYDDVVPPSAFGAYVGAAAHFISRS